jgi:mannosyltransferase OCH1-like enzyme
MPEEDRQRVKTWHQFFPDWEFREWNNHNIDFSSPYLRGAYDVGAWNRVSDYTRMDALARFGGLYLDTDVDVIRSFEPLLDRTAFLGFQLGDDCPEYMINGAVFGAEAGHWLPLAIRREFNEKLDGREDIGPLSGPGLLTQMLRQKGLSRYFDEAITIDDVTVFPRRYFYPYFMGENYSDVLITPDTYAIHRWAFTWNPEPSFRRKLLGAVAVYSPQLASQITRFARKLGLARSS